MKIKEQTILNENQRANSSMKIKEQTRKLAAGYSKHYFEVADRADVVKNINLKS
ncbi:hypothetical protein [Streptococcus pneumoniae]|uniref:hypothetical protein n=1 Tax=Streptococcus pneumoniae TaxID=1313 RepID=UPI000A9D6581|nr:hypothetical protein [Streptococcus pneumoniae]